MHQVKVSFTEQKSKEYQILVGKGLIQNLSKYFDFSVYSNIFIIADKNLQSLAEELLKKPLEEKLSRKITLLFAEAGEESKSVVSLERLWRELNINKCDRKSIIINFGGGATCDLGGFIASTYMRGVDFIQIATTLLAQVDASIGGKVAINLNSVKNLIGSFAQPKLVVIDTETLKTLPKREYYSGFAEIIKHGLIADKEYFNKLSSSKSCENPDEIIDIIERSCQIKAAIVMKDEKEQAERKTLNFGHTIGHAIESISHNLGAPLLHGEAISIGMMAEAKLSALKGFITENELRSIENCIKNYNLPVKLNFKCDSKAIFELCLTDKKNVSGNIKWVLLKSIGEAIYDQHASEQEIFEAIQSIF